MGDDQQVSAFVDFDGMVYKPQKEAEALNVSEAAKWGTAQVDERKALRGSGTWKKEKLLGGGSAMKTKRT